MATDEDSYDLLYDILRYHRYPNVFTKCDKRALRRKATNYKVKSGHLLYYHKTGQTWKQVPRSSTERVRILEACHSLPEGKLLCPVKLKYVQLYTTFI